MKKKAFDVVSICVFIILMLFITIFPANITNLTKSGLKMCLDGVIPSIFISMIFSQILTRTGITEAVGCLLLPIIKPVFGINKELCGAFITGIIGGFPNGAHSVGLMYNNGRCAKKDAEYCLALSNNCSIPFFISVIGLKILNNMKLGIIILVSNLVCIIIDSLILRKINLTTQNPSFCVNNSQQFEISDAICKSITSSCTSVVYITGFITFFYVISNIFSSFISLNKYSGTLFSGFLELFSGVLSINSSNVYEKTILCSILSGFSGISVIFQVAEATHRYGLSVKKFIITRILNMFLMPITSLLLMELVCF